MSSSLDGVTAYWRKLSSTILASSVWSEAASTRLVWITMIAMSDQNGHVLASVPGLARLAGVPLEDAVEAVRVLSSPDPHDRSKVEEGRRITPVDGGWLLVNFARYQEAAKAEAGRARKRDWWEKNRSPRRATRQLDGQVDALDRSERESETGEREEKEPPPPPRKPPSKRAGLVGSLAAAFLESRGEEPTWGKAEATAVNKFVKEHDLKHEDVVAAFRRLLADPFVGYESGSTLLLIKHFDKFRHAERAAAAPVDNDPAMAEARRRLHESR